ncbi:MAG: DUF4956 domain-containing protein [Flavobacteriales bacterium]|jgi:hypothetical protein|nr:DUF4956 domain-containing protein [Flavobacteriales bacterium]MBT6746286.1 DUF4956 domain-containing protein [Flavobacteriales bacterium]
MNLLLNILLYGKDFLGLGMELFDKSDFIELIVPFGVNLFFSFIIIRFIYYPKAGRKDYLFTYILFSIIVFFLFHMLSSTKLSTGAGLGLFAIMGIIRYRTDAIAIKEMTYLFVIIGLAVINALSNKKVSVTELMFANFTIMGIVFLLEQAWMLKQETSKVVIYEKIELIKPEKYEELLADLNERTGLKIERAVIGKIDFLRDTAQVRIYFHEDSSKTTA